jgi:hypothetical protein
MHNLTISGAHFRGNNPDIFRKVHLYQEVLVCDFTGCRNMKILRHLDDHVGFDVPSVFKDQRRGLVFCVSFNRASVRPIDQRSHIGVAELSIILERRVAGFGKPWRHLARNDGFLDGFSPGA